MVTISPNQNHESGTLSRWAPCTIGLLCVLLTLFILPRTSLSSSNIKIASIYASTGPAAHANRSSILGVRLAVEEINTSGGLLGRTVELLEIDNHSSPIGSKVAALRAAKSEACAIIGAAYSSHSLAIAKVAQDHRVPMITNVSTSPAVTRVGNYIFRICFNDLIQGRVMAQFAREELQIKTVATLYDMASDYSIGIVNSFEQAYKSNGGLVAAKIPYKSRQPHFRDAISQAKIVQPEALFIAGHDESGRIVGEAIQRGLPAIPLGGDGWDEPSFFDRGGNQIKLGYYSTHWSPSIETAPSRRFVERYGHLNTLSAPTALAYDALYLLADAVERAGTSRRDDVRKALARTKKFIGVTGTISFDAFGDPVKDVVIIKIKDGVPEYVKQVGLHNTVDR